MCHAKRIRVSGEVPRITRGFSGLGPTPIGSPIGSSLDAGDVCSFMFTLFISVCVVLCLYMIYSIQYPIVDLKDNLGFQWRLVTIVIHPHRSIGRSQGRGFMRFTSPKSMVAADCSNGLKPSWNPLTLAAMWRV